VDEFVEYWKNQFIVEYYVKNFCQKCPKSAFCWNEFVSYSAEAILKACEHEKMKKAISELVKLRPQPWNLGNEGQCKLAEKARRLAEEELGAKI